MPAPGRLERNCENRYLKIMISHNLLNRRAALGLAMGTIASAFAPKPLFAALAPSENRQLLERAKAALDSHGRRIRRQDRMAVVDFSRPSSDPRLFLVDLHGGTARALRVTHGRGSDPDHSGWLRRFSNQPDSLASSHGAFVTGSFYSGKHGRAQKLVGLDPSNDNALERAIVIHGAWYANDDVVANTGKLGRSEGCFALAENRRDVVMTWLGEGRLLFADKA